MIKKFTRISLLLLLCAVHIACSVKEPENSLNRDDRIALLDYVWNNVRDRYYDPDFNGLDWPARYDYYLPLAAQASSEDDLIGLLNRMLFELNSSHCGLDTLSGIQAKVSPYLFAKGMIGLDIRIIEDAMVIKEVVPGSPADLMGMKPGFVIERIDGRSLDDIKSLVIDRPPCNEQNRKFHLTSEILRSLYGPANTGVRIQSLDGENKPLSVTLQRQARSNPVSLSPAIPPVYLESTSRILNERIAYLRFNAFQPPDLGPVIDQLNRVSHAQALVIDLRGNDGGSIEAMKHLLGRFVRERLQYGTYVSRSERNPDYIVPEGNRFKGKVAVLVDEMSISGAENMPYIMQLLNLAEIIGERTPGQLLCGDFSVHQERFGLVLPIAKLVYTDGKNPEGQGVVPDQLVALDRDSLLRGVDPQLQAAIDYLSE